MLLDEYDYETDIEVQREEAREQGRAEGREEGREQGRAEGRKQGKEEGREEGRKEEKRALLFDKKAVTKGNIEREIRNFEVKLYGENWKISLLKDFQEMKDELIWKLSEEI